eukprot:gene17539-23859_t
MQTLSGFHHSKATLDKCKCPGDKWIISADSSPHKASKCYLWFSDEELDAFFNTYANNLDNLPHFYEIIPDKRTTPVYICMDIDRPVDPTDPMIDDKEFVDLFTHKFTCFIKQVYGYDIVTKLGSNFQVATSHTPTKFSCHIKIDIPCMNLLCVLQIVNNFNSYILSNIYNTPEETGMFTFYDKDTPLPNSVIDNAIYSNFRSFRLLYSSKFKKDKNHPLLPWGTSSTRIQDHLVCIHDPEYNRFPGVELPDVEAIIGTNTKLIDHAHISLKNTRVILLETHEYNGDSKIATNVVDNIKHYIATNKQIKKFFNPKKEFCITNAHALSPHVHAFYTDGLPCVYTSVDKQIALDSLKKLIGCISASRANDYNDWMTVGFALKNSSTPGADLLDVWIDFSRQSPKFNLDDCYTKWNSMSPDRGITCSTLHKMARQDSDSVPEFKHTYTKKTKVHSGGMMEYHHNKNILVYKCSNPCCKLAQCTTNPVFQLNSLGDMIKKLNGMTSKDGLHNCHDIIQWDEVYNEPIMHEYPIHPIVCIRAQMGAGKTKGLTDMFAKTMNKKTTCLVITYGITLAKKYTKELSGFGFISYQDVKGKITDTKVVVCLDSLHRVDIKFFDYVIIDEAVSVCNHFNSRVMTNRSLNCEVFEAIARKASHIYFLDACVDNDIVYNMVDFIAAKMPAKIKVKPMWIRNEYIRENNRKVISTVCTNTRLTEELQMKAIHKIQSLLLQKKKVVVSANTKSFAIKVYEFVKKEFSNMNVIIHTSDHQENNVLLRNVAEEWKKADCLIYSPTVTAGVSFEELHFDSLVAYVQNGFDLGTADLALQQMFRVRNLTDGDMSLFVLNTLSVKKEDYPIFDEDIEKLLDKNIQGLHSYYPVKDGLFNFVSRSCGNEGLVYDKDKLSFSILKGIISNTNRSLLSFYNIIANTLTEDYDISVTTELLSNTDSDIPAELKTAIKSIDDAKETELVFSKELVIDRDQYEKCIEKKVKSGEPLTPEERTKKWVYDMRTRYQVEKDMVDQNFLDVFIGPFD